MFCFSYFLPYSKSYFVSLPRQVTATLLARDFLEQDRWWQRCQQEPVLCHLSLSFHFMEECIMRFTLILGQFKGSFCELKDGWPPLLGIFLGVYPPAFSSLSLSPFIPSYISCSFLQQIFLSTWYLLIQPIFIECILCATRGCRCWRHSSEVADKLSECPTWWQRRWSCKHKASRYKLF